MALVFDYCMNGRIFGKTAEVAIVFGKLGEYKDANSLTMELWDGMTQRDAISAGWYHTLALKADGTVVIVGNNDDGRCNVERWTDIMRPKQR